MRPAPTVHPVSRNCNSCSPRTHRPRGVPRTSSEAKCAWVGRTRTQGRTGGWRRAGHRIPRASGAPPRPGATSPAPIDEGARDIRDPANSVDHRGELHSPGVQMPHREPDRRIVTRAEDAFLRVSDHERRQRRAVLQRLSRRPLVRRRARATAGQHRSGRGPLPSDPPGYTKDVCKSRCLSSLSRAFSTTRGSSPGSSPLIGCAVRMRSTAGSARPWRGLRRPASAARRVQSPSVAQIGKDPRPGSPPNRSLRRASVWSRATRVLWTRSAASRLISSGIGFSTMNVATTSPRGFAGAWKRMP
jgi:hypothetical protein